MLLLRRLLLSSLLVSTAVTLRAAGTFTPDPALGNPDRRQHLYEIGRKYLDANFDPDANLVGAQTGNPPNKKKHSSVSSMAYVNTLLMTDDPDDRARAMAVLKNVLAAQDTQPDSPTCGVFGWYTEDHATDPNAAEFVGLGLASVLDRDRDHPFLDADLRSKTEQAFRLAVDAALRRDVDPGYTNIALASCALAAAGQKLYAIPKTDTFAETKLDAVMKLVGDGEFSEYLSPTYYSVGLGAVYGARHFSFSDGFGAKCDAAIDKFWKQIAADYHAPTFQLAGPFMRSYGDNMLNYSAALKYWLALALPDGYPLPDTETEHDWDKSGAASIALVPLSPRPEFKETPQPWRQWDATNGLVRHLSQFRDGDFILSTVDPQDEWKQKRNLVAYWRNDGPAPENMSVGFCLDESNETLPDHYPYGEAHFHSQQKNGAALVAIVAGANLPAGGGSSLVFNKTASVADAAANPLTVQDGTVTTYIFPVSTGTPQFEVKPDDRLGTVHVNRSWDGADVVGSRKVLAYLIVFKPSSQPAPQVSGLALKADTGDLVTVTASVDGTDFSLPSIR
jgi:hypothetical protein